MDGNADMLFPYSIVAGQFSPGRGKAQDTKRCGLASS
jgi:hypothetical protein